MSFLGNLAKYIPTPQKTQTENLLTEWLAESLRVSRAFFENLIVRLRGNDRLLPEFCSDRVNIGTQVPVRFSAGSEDASGIGFLDLEVQDGEQILALEVKWDAAESDAQLHNYRQHLSALEQEYGKKAYLAYLAKESPDPKELSCKPDFCATWMDVCGALEATLRTPDIRSHPETTEAYMLGQLHAFLKEEGMESQDLSVRMIAASAEVVQYVKFSYQVLEKTVNRIEPDGSDFWGRRNDMSDCLYRGLLERGRLITWKQYKSNLNAAFGFLLSPDSKIDQFIQQPVRYTERFPWVSTWVSIDPKLREKRTQVSDPMRVFAENYHEKGWYYTDDYKAWRIIYRLKPLLDFQALERSREEIIGWFCESMEHLKEGGIRSILEKVDPVS